MEESQETKGDSSLRPAESQQAPATAAIFSRRFSVEEVGFFEGTEKLLEVWFNVPCDNAKSRGLRDIPM